MLNELNNVDDEKRHDIMEAFLNDPTPHGAMFDNGKRWCGICESIQTPIIESTSKDEFGIVPVSWKARACPYCSGIWPEHMHEFAYRMHNDTEFHEMIHEEFGPCILN